MTKGGSTKSCSFGVIVDDKDSACTIDKYKCKTEKISWLFDINTYQSSPYYLLENNKKNIGKLSDFYDIPKGCSFETNLNNVKFSPNYITYNKSTKGLMTHPAEVFDE